MKSDKSGKSDIYLKGAPLSEKTFREPPRELGILPFWFWNGDMKTGEMKWQAAQYKEKGLAGLFIHPRFGLEVPFLSKRWMDKVGFAIRETDKLDMQVWIYDEYNWPSGTAYKKVPNKYPDLQQRYIELTVLDADGPTFVFLEGYDSRY
ncbi:MAG: hypothetical protein GTO55_07395, partial [Armatimonadetes bacterium]|nr:hypothetical protein [Armatimonadota bacterium]NIM24095.1 hypothetical protein [Armatimonadota bacterium]NIM67949.1 hypothetical protein [Armatimonadota bacterium]NIM76471.1 hypothetical protein [Armatimonadota bacterium]NIN06179.1 hypothetical protein [Armatimonadota bacterium]